MDSGAFAVLAEIVVGAHRAHESDALDGGHLTAVADDVLKDGVLLLLLLLDKVVMEHFLELSGAEILDLFADHLDDFNDAL